MKNPKVTVRRGPKMVSKTTKGGTAPAVAMINPKYAHNVGAAVRAASCYGIGQVWYSGNRVSLDPKSGERLPREERMRGYADVELHQYDYIFDRFDSDVTPVAIEIRENAEQLPHFEHPEKALYVFGAEDGGLERNTLQHCHRVLFIPTRHCLNVAAAINVVLYDRYCKRLQNGLEPPMSTGEILAEDRGWGDSSGLFDRSGEAKDL